MLHRQPPIIAVPRVRVHAEAELLDIKRQRFVLVADVNSGHSDTLAHGTSFSFSAVPLPFESSRRFSETAIVRFGRCAARTKQCGTCDSACDAAFSRARSSLGLSPVTSRNTRPKVPRLF